jgi:hypothetical protein
MSRAKRKSLSEKYVDNQQDLGEVLEEAKKVKDWRIERKALLDQNGRAVSACST